MNRYSFHPALLMRSPAYPFSHKEYYSLQEHLDCQYFRNSLFLASPSFYAELKKTGFQKDLLKPKAVQALFNYLNRLYYRSTPFGLFSGFGITRWQKISSLAEPVRIGSRRLHVLPAVQPYDPEQPIPEGLEQMFVYSNPSLYNAGNGHRFLKKAYSHTERRYDYHISSIPFHKVMSRILGWSEKPILITRLLHLICNHLGAGLDEASSMIRHMIGEHLLLTDNHEPVLQPKESPHTILKHALLSEPLVIQIADTSYTGLEYNECKGNVPLHRQSSLIDGLKALHRICVDVSPDGLRAFRSAFLQKFEDRSVPLMTALDPELGVGYRRLEHTFDEPVLLRGLAFRSTAPAYKQVHWTAAHALLLDKMQRATNIYTEGIHLDDEDIAGLPLKDEQLPPSLSVLFRPLGDKVFIESSGGATATAILGRFSVFNGEVKTMLEEVADNEVQSNPSVAFAEINAIQEIHTANVERRLKSYPYEIPLMVYPSSDAAQIIALSELRIRVAGDRIILWSDRLQREVIPRLSSAFNHTRSQLHVYRFLCDLQYQGLRTNFTLDLSHFFPALSFYPRVTYKGAILSLATWQIPKATMRATNNDIACNGVGDFRSYLLQLGVPRHFATYNGDQQIVFNADSDADLVQCLQLMRSGETISLKEFPFPDDNHPVTDTAGRLYLPQYVSVLTHNHEVYESRTKVVALEQTHEQKRIAENWAYFKVYCHPGHSISIIEAMAGLMDEELKEKGLADLFFFVIYKDPAYHIRFRFRCTTETKGSVMIAVEKKLAFFRDAAQVGSIQSDTYKRELERYGPGNIELVEAIFDTSTKWVLERGHIYFQDEAAIGTIATDTARLLYLFSYSLTDKALHCQKIFESLFQELNGDRDMLTALKGKYRLLKEDLYSRLSKDETYEPDDVIQKLLSRQIEDLLHCNASNGVVPRESLCSDIIHMNLNRIFIQQPREQEMVIYFFLYQYYRSEIARSGIISSPQDPYASENF
jgi:thiopeptide-type bacteriocin biosynthesis protein